jgi:hypothetical protein
VYRNNRFPATSSWPRAAQRASIGESTFRQLRASVYLTEATYANSFEMSVDATDARWVADGQGC